MKQVDDNLGEEQEGICPNCKHEIKKHKDKELAEFYKNLMISEANHYTMFLGFARKYGERKEVDAKWQQLLEYESEIISNLGKTEAIHG